jgi:hypothetical protein
MTVTYTHLTLNEDVLAPSGYYTPLEETRIELDGREVLAVASQTVIESSCCGIADFCSTTVPGYIVRWRYGTDARGNPVTEVEPIGDAAARERVLKALRGPGCRAEIEFW